MCIGAAAAVLALPIGRTENSDPLAAGFQNPPASAKPRVWWHWIDGNVSEQGIQKDLTWLNRIGVGGVHNFDAALTGPGQSAPRWVSERVAYLTPRWQELFRLAVGQAQQLGMEFTIASSPGWSESGGPWVKPEAGMKKLVWSETVLEGGRRFTGRLAMPPHVTGPFQNVPFTTVPFATSEKLPEYYADAAVVAFRSPGSGNADANSKPAITSSAGPIDAQRLSDGDLAEGVSLPFGTDPTSWIQFSYPTAQRIQAITVAVARPPSLGPSDMASGGAIWLEASEDGRAFHRVVDVPRTGAPEQTLAFVPTTARVFRLVLARVDPQPNPFAALFGRTAPPPTAHSILECVLHTEPRVNRFEDKDGFTNRAILASDDTRAIDSREAIGQDAILDLTGKMHSDGTLDWTPPPGRWVVLRFGYSLTGRTNHPASREGTGLEVDKLNARHVKAYFDAYFAEYQKTLGPQSMGQERIGQQRIGQQRIGQERIGQQPLQYMLTDSYEAGIANWTDDLLSQFKRLRGYDARPWLPVLAGRVVGSAAASDRFLWDFRQTLADLIAEAHYGQLSALLHEHGMKRYGESHESGRAFVGDGMQVKKSADVPMGALWAAAPWDSDGITYNMDIRESASVAHLYGQNLVAAESLTAFGNTFAFAPESLKPYADRELAMGLNRFVIHTSVHQPDDRLGPGITLGPFGQWFTRHETWAEQAGPWISYLTRSAYLLQQGRFVADIAYLYGEDNNITNLFGREAPPVSPGYNYDFVNADALIHLLSAKDGRITTPSGMQYRVLALDPSTQRMSLPVLRKIHELVKQGATVIGPRPTMTPSLADNESEFESITEALWGSARAGASGSGSHSGQQPAADTVAQAGSAGSSTQPSRAVLTGALSDVLPRLSIAPDVEFDGSEAGAQLRYVHRALDPGDLYFVSNGSSKPQKLEASFRVSGGAAEIWRADTGERAPASYRFQDGRTVVPLMLEGHESLFVVFRQPTSQASRVVPERVVEVVGGVKGPWDVRFPPNHGAPARARFDSLTSWTESADPGIRYFSGTASYETRLTVDRRWLEKGARIQLNLGDVKNLAEVSVNGRSLGVLWKRPFVIDVTEALQPGENRLGVKITNLWPNRMIGDKQPGAQQIAYATFDPYKADSPLLPSGLLGPVTISRVLSR